MNKYIQLIKTAFRRLKEYGLKETVRRTGLYLKYLWIHRCNKRTDFLDRKAPYEVTEKETVYILSYVPFYDIGGGQRCSQLAKTFAKLGYAVRYLYVDQTNDKVDARVSLPFFTHAVIDKKSTEYVKKIAKENDVFVFEAPMSAMHPFVEIAKGKGCKIVYENVDNWETSLGSYFFNEKTLIDILKGADVLVGSAKPLVAQLEAYLEKYGIDKSQKKILYLANAVDEALFCGQKEYEMPKDMVLGKNTLLYYGALWGEWFDWDLLIELAKRHPDYAVNLIGDPIKIAPMMHKFPKNFYFLGLKKQKELPAYLAYADFAMIPFKRGAIGDYVSPLKIFEYIIMYKNVLCTTLPDVQGYPNVYCGDTVDEWDRAILQASSADHAAADDFREKNTWTYRATIMLEALFGKK